MEARAYLKYARIAPRKVQIVLDLIRGKDAQLARAILKHTPKAACEPLEKLLNSAVANAENNFNMDKNNHWCTFGNLRFKTINRTIHNIFCLIPLTFKEFSHSIWSDSTT